MRRHFVNYKEFKKVWIGVFLLKIYICVTTVCWVWEGLALGAIFEQFMSFFFNLEKPTTFCKPHVQLDLTWQERKCILLSPQIFYLLINRGHFSIHHGSLGTLGNPRLDSFWESNQTQGSSPFSVAPADGVLNFKRPSSIWNLHSQICLLLWRKQGHFFRQSFTEHWFVLRNALETEDCGERVTAPP